MCACVSSLLNDRGWREGRGVSRLDEKSDVRARVWVEGERRSGRPTDLVSKCYY